MGTQLTQNILDKYSGYKPDIKITDGVVDAGLAGVAMGGVFSGGLYGAKALSGENQSPAQDYAEPYQPENNPRMQAEESYREFFRQNANQDNGKLQVIGETTANGEPTKYWYIKKGSVEDLDGSVLVVDDEGNEALRTKDQLQTAQEIGEEDFVSQRLGEWDIQQGQSQTETMRWEDPEGNVHNLSRYPNDEGVDIDQGYEVFQDENGQNVPVPLSEVKSWEEGRQNSSNASLVTRVYGKQQFSGIKNHHFP
jgi:hypothetical protein